jgi:hypothetical protein
MATVPIQRVRDIIMGPVDSVVELTFREGPHPRSPAGGYNVSVPQNIFSFVKDPPVAVGLEEQQIFT